MKPRFLLPAACSLLLAFPGCAGVTAEDLEPHVAAAQNLAERNNAAIAIHCVGMADDDRQALIRDNIDHAAQLGALQQSAGAGPGWLSQVIAWALSFSRLAGIVAADPPIDDAPDEHAMDGNNTTDPDTPTPDDDGDGIADALEAALADSTLWVRVEADEYHPDEHPRIRALVPPGTLVRLLGTACPCGCVQTSAPGYVWVVYQEPEWPTHVMFQIRRADLAHATVPRCCPGCDLPIDLDEAPAIVGGAAWHLECARRDPHYALIDVSPDAMRAALRTIDPDD